MSAAIGLVLVVLQLVAGLALARRLGPAGDPWWARAAWAHALGGAVVGLVQIALSALGLAAGVGVPVACAALSLAALAVAGRAGGGARAAADAATDAVPGGRGGVGVPAGADLDPRARRALLALTLVVGLVGASASAGLPFRTDGSKFWAPRARELAAHGALEAPALTEEYRVAFHRTYPLLVPTLMAPAFAHGPRDAMVGPKLVLAAYHLALLGVVASVLLRCGRRGGWVLLAFLGSPLLVRTEIRESAVAAGFVDEVVALYLLLVVLAVERLRGAATVPSAEGGERGALPLAILAGAALVATKLEGAAALGIVLIAALLAGPRGRGRAVALAAGVAVLSLPTLWIATGVLPDEPILAAHLLLDPANLMARGLPVVYEVLAALLDVSALGVLPLLVAVVITGLPGRDRAHARWLLLGVLGFLVLVYLGTTMHVGRHVHTSAHRLLFQWMPALAVLTARALASAPADEAWAEADGTRPAPTPAPAPTPTHDTGATEPAP